MQGLRKFMAGAFVAGAMMVGAGSASAGDWSGVYIGANAGWSGSNYDWAFNPAAAGAHQAYSMSQDRGIYGIQVGAQAQFNQFVLGVEAGYSGFGAWNDSWGHDPAFGVNPAFASEARLNNLFTVGPRVGWAPSNKWMLFATGGFATGTINTRAVNNATGAELEGTAHTHTGWFVGGGVEYALTKNWILGLEYQHVDLGSELHCAALPCNPLSTDNRDVSGQSDVVRARLSFKLGRPDEVMESLK